MKNKLCVLCAFMALCIAFSCFNLPFVVAENTQVISDNRRELPSDMGENLISNLRPMYVDYACGIGVTSTRDIYPYKLEIANGNLSDNWYYSPRNLPIIMVATR